MKKDVPFIHNLTQLAKYPLGTYIQIIYKNNLPERSCRCRVKVIGLDRRRKAPIKVKVIDSCEFHRKRTGTNNGKIFYYMMRTEAIKMKKQYGN